MSSFILGYQGYLYIADNALDHRFIGGTGTYDYNDVTWSEIENVMDVDGNFESESVDTTTRSEAKTGWSSKINTTKSGTLNFTMRWQPGSSIFQQIQSAWLNTTEIALLDLDGELASGGSTSAQGLCANFTVSFSQKKPVKGIVTVDVTAEVSSYPDWVYVQTGDGSLDVSAGA